MSIENQEAFMTSLKWNMSDLIERTKIQSYVDNAEPSEAEVVGLIVSKYFKWNGTEIMEVMLSSLEDANFHELRERLLKTYKEWEAEPSENDFNNAENAKNNLVGQGGALEGQPNTANAMLEGDKKEDKKPVSVSINDHSFEIVLRILGNELVATRIASSNFSGKLIAGGVLLLFFTFMILEVFGLNEMLK